MARVDQYYGKDVGLSDQSNEAKAVIPHNSNALPGGIPKALFVGTGGNITMRGEDDDTDTVWKNIPNGSIIPFRPEFIRATGTTAADILALY